MHQPGTTWEYSYSTDVLGRVIEVVEDTSLLAAMRERVLGPLGMKDTTFYVTDRPRQERLVEPFANDRTIGAGATFFDPRVAQKWESGGGGLMGTAGVSAVAGSVGELNWGGAGGTYFWIDPREDLFVVYMMQSPKQRVPYRAVLKDMVYATITRPAAR
jgi:CubicO group peptidase (beta-lactamase class C family)